MWAELFAGGFSTCSFSVEEIPFVKSNKKNKKIKIEVIIKPTVARFAIFSLYDMVKFDSICLFDFRLLKV